MWGLKYFTRSTLLFSMFSEHVDVSRSNRPRKNHDVDYSSATVFGCFWQIFLGRSTFEHSYTAGELGNPETLQESQFFSGDR